MLIGFGEESLQSNPFEYRLWSGDFLPDELYRKVEKELYAWEPTEDSILNSHESCYPQGQTHIAPNLAGFRDLWHMPAYKRWLQEKLGWPENVEGEVEVTVHIDSMGFEQEPHRDIKDTKSPLGYGTLQIYFGSQELEETGAWLLDREHDHVVQVPFQRNTAWCFLAGEDTWHEVCRIDQPVNRRSIMINMRQPYRHTDGFKDEYNRVVEAQINAKKTGTFRDHKSIDFCITTYCQSKCPTCPRTDTDTLELASFIQQQHMPFPVWFDVIDKVDWSDKTIQFCGEHGDPMMHPEIDKFILAGAERAWNVMVNTNGGIRKAQWYTDIYDRVEDCDYGELSFVFAIDGLSQEVNEKYRIDVDFERAWENFLTCAQISSRLTQWDYLVFEHNWHELEDVIRTARELDVNLDIKINKGEYGLLTSAEGKQHVNKILGIDVDRQEQQVVTDNNGEIAIPQVTYGKTN